MGDGPTYITFDVDGLDPVYAPGTGTPEIGGYDYGRRPHLVTGAEGPEFDWWANVVEVAPPFDQTGNTSLVGATLMYEIFCLLADKVASARKLMM